MADEEVPRHVPRPDGDDRLLRSEEDSGEGVDLQAVQLGRELPAHQLRGGQARRPGGRRHLDRRLRHDGFAAGCAGQGGRSASRLRARRAGDDQRREEVGAGDGRGNEQDRRPQRRGADRHRRESLRRHEEPRRVRSPGHDGPVRGPHGDRATDGRSRDAALARSAVAGSCRDGVLRLLVRAEDGRADGILARRCRSR